MSVTTPRAGLYLLLFRLDEVEDQLDGIARSLLEEDADSLFSQAEAERVLDLLLTATSAVHEVRNRVATRKNRRSHSLHS